MFFNFVKYQNLDIQNKTEGDTIGDKIISTYKEKIRNVANALLKNMKSYIQSISGDTFGSRNNMKIL